MGEYRRVDGLSAQGRPVWRMGDADRYFYYDSSTLWIVGPDYTASRGWIQSVKFGITEIPLTGWDYSAPGWTSDSKLTVGGEWMT